MRTSKGAAIALVSTITGIFIFSGSIFTGLMTTQQITETVNYSSGHVNNLLEAQTRKKIYEKNIQAETRFVYNNIAYRNSNWTWEQNIPEESEIKEKIREKMFTGEHNILRQNRVFRCQAPSLSKEDLEIVSEEEMHLEMSNKHITCFGGDSKAIVPVKNRITADTNQNNYLNILKYGQILANNAKTDINILEKVENQISTECIDQNTPQSEIRLEAIAEAKTDALEDNQNYAEKIFGQTEDKREEYVRLRESKTYVNGSKTVNINQVNCEGDGQRFTGSVEFTPEILTTKFVLTDSENEIITYDGNQHIQVDLKYSFDLE